MDRPYKVGGKPKLNQNWLKSENTLAKQNAKPAKPDSKAIAEAEEKFRQINTELGMNRYTPEQLFQDMCMVITHGMTLIANNKAQAEKIDKMEFSSGCLYCMDNQELIQELGGE